MESKMRKILVLFLSAFVFVACGDTSDSESVEEDNHVNESESDIDNNDDAEEDEDLGSEGAYEYTSDINQITKDNRFQGGAGTIAEMIETDEVIADNENFKLTAVRRIKMVELYQIYQLELENKSGHELYIRIVKAEADGNDQTGHTYMDLSSDISLDEDDIEYITITVDRLDGEHVTYDELKLNLEVISYGEENYAEVIDEPEIILEY